MSKECSLKCNSSFFLFLITMPFDLNMFCAKSCKVFKPLRKTKHMTFLKTIDRHWKDNNPANNMISQLFAPPPLAQILLVCDICDILCDNCGTA